MTTGEQAILDMNLWYRNHYPRCPHCRLDFLFAKRYNLVEHWQGRCERYAAAAEVPEDGIARHWREQWEMEQGAGK